MPARHRTLAWPENFSCFAGSSQAQRSTSGGNGGEAKFSGRLGGPSLAAPIPPPSALPIFRPHSARCPQLADHGFTVRMAVLPIDLCSGRSRDTAPWTGTGLPV